MRPVRRALEGRRNVDACLLFSCADLKRISALATGFAAGPAKPFATPPPHIANDAGHDLWCCGSSVDVVDWSRRSSESHGPDRADGRPQSYCRGKRDDRVASAPKS